MWKFLIEASFLCVSSYLYCKVRQLPREVHLDSLFLLCPFSRSIYSASCPSFTIVSWYFEWAWPTNRSSISGMRKSKDTFQLTCPYSPSSERPRQPDRVPPYSSPALRAYGARDDPRRYTCSSESPRRAEMTSQAVPSRTIYLVPARTVKAVQRVVPVRNQVQTVSAQSYGQKVGGLLFPSFGSNDIRLILEGSKFQFQLIFSFGKLNFLLSASRPDLARQPRPHRGTSRGDDEFGSPSEEGKTYSFDCWGETESKEDEEPRCCPDCQRQEEGRFQRFFFFL